MFVGGRLNLYTCTGQCIAASRAVLSRQTRTFNHAMVEVLGRTIAAMDA